jgi:hypothetical protein
VFGCGREAELVVDDDVHRATDVVPGDLGEVEGLGHDALTREGGVDNSETAKKILGLLYDQLK